MDDARFSKFVGGYEKCGRYRKPITNFGCGLKGFGRLKNDIKE